MGIYIHNIMLIYQSQRFHKPSRSNTNANVLTTIEFDGIVYRECNVSSTG
jgi:hypothetical protein